MKNYSLSRLEDYEEHRLTDFERANYSKPIYAIGKQKNLKFNIPTACDNTTMIRLDIEPRNQYTDLDKFQREFNALLSRYPKSYFQINGDRLSFYRPKDTRMTLQFKKLLESEEYDEYIRSNPDSLPICYGETVDNRIIIKDLKEQTHILIGGTSGSGKSVLLHSIVNSLMYHLIPEQLRFAFFDFKGVEFTCYEDSPYLEYPICTDPKDSERVLGDLIKEMENRYKDLRESRLYDIETYNQKNPDNPMHYIVVIVDEFADVILRNKKGIEDKVQSIAQKARACGIHLIISTQNPIVEVCTTLIKANLPTRIALFVPSHDNSQVIIEESGAQNLLKKGDMLLKDGETIRLQGAFLSKMEIIGIQQELIYKYGKKEFKDNVVEETTIDDNDNSIITKKRLIKEGDKVNDRIVLDDETFDIAVMAIENNKASKTQIRGYLNSGDNLAYEYIDKLLAHQIIDEYDKKRLKYPIIISQEEFNNKFISISEV